MSINPGDKFGSLTVVEFSRTIRMPNRSTTNLWVCICECGEKREIRATNLQSGHTRGCGRHKFVKRERVCELPEWKVWCGMLARCKHKPSYSGITVCERWKVFKNFFADMGRRPSPSHSIDRIDVNGNYEPSNCRWATVRQQQNNRRRTVYLTYNGETRTLTDWVEVTGFYRNLLQARLRRGWSVERTLTEPVNDFSGMMTRRVRLEDGRVAPGQLRTV